MVVATEDNYSRLQQVADRPLVYSGQAPINYNNTTTHHIAKQAWKSYVNCNTDEGQKQLAI